MGKIIVLEDNILFAEVVCRWLQHEGWQTETITTISRAKKLMENADANDIVLADLRLPDGESTALLEWMRKNGMEQPFIVMTDYAEVHTAVASMKLGSMDYIPKRMLEDKLIPIIKGIVQKQKAASETFGNTPIFNRDSEAFRQIKERIRLVAPTDMSVLILGENGTGKEHIAQRIHEKSKRAKQPFVSVDCGSISPSLAQSAFFGHVKGAFTGADTNKVGYFQEANGGTLFLDEVGNLPYEIQQMLLRVIQERKYRPVGAKEDKNCNVRIVAATNEDLVKAVIDKRFRQDLLYRLQDFKIMLPPLRNCQEDIMPLAEFFREQSNKTLEKAVKGFDSSAKKALQLHPWSGNVRELKQKIQTAVLLCEGNNITEDDLELYVEQETSPVCYSLKDVQQEKERIKQALEQCGGNKVSAAKLLKIGRTTLYAKMKEYGLN
ncbi:MAG: sigma-54-dependent Fis family transcriptional regulator [Alphaproteobacteria bacterium]|nr:sigma-54-dependent Fis family transcriptional regulator [Alphaproteobacteria bacterium]MBQ4058197.1 sigma-54-dependent Fis family transcriptional regulator [Lachnospiraceae bacterium]